jgi:hypothetical protein
MRNTPRHSPGGGTAHTIAAQRLLSDAVWPEQVGDRIRRDARPGHDGHGALVPPKPLAEAIVRERAPAAVLAKRWNVSVRTVRTWRRQARADDVRR